MDRFSTATDNQVNVSIPIYEGERSIAQQNKRLGTVEITGIHPQPRGVPQIEVTFAVAANGSVTVGAVDKGTGNLVTLRMTTERFSDVYTLGVDLHETGEGDNPDKTLVQMGKTEQHVPIPANNKALVAELAHIPFRDEL